VSIGILGGTFDPIHLGHLLLAETTRETLALQQVLFVPAGDPPHKQAATKTAAHHRRTMVELGIIGNPCFELSLIDLERPGPHYTTDTVRLLRERHHLSPDECFFIIGGDSLVDLPTWHNAAELISLCRLAVSRRPGYQPDLSTLEKQLPGLSKRMDWVDMPVLGLEASTIRERVRAGRTIRYRVTETVCEYIESNGLYCS
jgi:nicotinate-nucleotide adenylyltransferase